MSLAPEGEHNTNFVMYANRFPNIVLSAEEEGGQSCPPREEGQSCSLELPAMDGCGIIWD